MKASWTDQIEPILELPFRDFYGEVLTIFSDQVEEFPCIRNKEVMQSGLTTPVANESVMFLVRNTTNQGLLIRYAEGYMQAALYEDQLLLKCIAKSEVVPLDDKWRQTSCLLVEDLLETIDWTVWDCLSLEDHLWFASISGRLKDEYRRYVFLRLGLRIHKERLVKTMLKKLITLLDL